MGKEFAGKKAAFPQLFSKQHVERGNLHAGSGIVGQNPPAARNELGQPWLRTDSMQSHLTGALHPTGLPPLFRFDKKDRLQEKKRSAGCGNKNLSGRSLVGVWPNATPLPAGGL